MISKRIKALQVKETDNEAVEVGKQIIDDGFSYLVVYGAIGLGLIGLGKVFGKKKEVQEEDEEE